MVNTSSFLLFITLDTPIPGLYICYFDIFRFKIIFLDKNLMPSTPILKTYVNLDTHLQYLILISPL